MANEADGMAHLKRGSGPILRGRIVSESEDGVVLECGGCVVEVLPEHIAERRVGAQEASLAEYALTDDAAFVVSIRVLPQRRVIGDSLFHNLIVGGLMADNCNCNCNCGSGNCNCNCNCSDCTECSVCSVPQSLGLRVRTGFRNRQIR